MDKYIDIIINKLNTWVESVVAMLPNFALAIIVLVLFVLGAKLVHRFSKKLLNKWYNNIELNNLLSKVAYVTVIVIGTMVSLSILELSKTVTSVLAGAGIIGLALAFAFQDIAANFVSGFFMAAKGPFEVEQVVEINGVQGIVKAINLRTTEVLTFDGNTVIIPNKEIFQNNITNFQKSRKRRVSLEVGVSYDDDLDRVEEVAVSAVKEIPFILEEDGVSFFYTEFGGSSINFEIRFWVPYDEQMQYLSGKSEAIKKIKKAFEREGFTIPFPIRTLDFGIKGGEKLNEVLHGDDLKKAS
jgi:small-conductance mechanosensitive channel